MSKDYGSSIQWALAAVVALGVWAAALVSLTVASRSRTPEPQSAGLEFGGDEPPAIANLLAHGWKLRHAAVSATLVDLAARDVVVIDEPAADRYTVQVLTRPNDLTPYEQQVLNLVTDLSRDDKPVPFEALTTGESSDAGKWWKRFEKSVIAESRSRGLSRNRWQAGHWLVIAVVALVPAVLAAAAIVALPDSSTDSSNDDNPVVGFIALAAVGWAALMAVFGWIRAERDTDAGLAVAGRWLGLRDNLEAGTFADMEPTAVAIWDRYLAYAVAMGVAETTARAIPLGAESDTEAWSSVTGHWRLVRVSYARIGLLPGWGRAPVSVLFGGLLKLGVLAGLVYGVRRLWSDEDLGVDLPEIDQRIVAAIGIVGAVVAARALSAVVVGLLDIGRHRQIEGLVLRVRSHDEVTRWAVDDGSTDEIRAFTGRAGGVWQGARVRVDVSPRLGFVRSVEVLSTAPASADGSVAIPVMAELPTDPAATAAALGIVARLDPVIVAEALGRPVEGGEAKPFPGGATRPFHGDGVGIVVTVATAGGGPLLYRQSTIIPSFLRRDVPGVGDEATWIMRHSLAVLSGPSAILIGIRAKNLDNDERLSAAVTIARELLTLDSASSPA